MSRFVLLTALATAIQSVAFAQTPPAAPVPPTPPAVAAPMAPPAAPQTPRPSRQGTPAPPAPVPPMEPNAPRALFGQTFSGTPTNVRLELVLTDTYSGTPVKKTVSMLVVLGQNGMIRSSSVVGGSTVELNVDAMARYWANTTINSTFARPAGGRGGRGAAPGQNTATTPITAVETNDGQRPILLNLTLQYSPAASSSGPRPAALNQSLSVIVQDGKPLLVSQSADPASDRKVTVEVTATILK